MLISAIVGGFLFLYLETRTRVMWLFTDTEEALLSPALSSPMIQTSFETPIDRDNGPTPSPLSPQDQELLKVPFEALQTAEQQAAWGSAQARAGRYQAATQALQDAIAKQPDRKDFLLRLAEVRQRQGLPQAAIALISEARQQDQNDPALQKRELLTALYLPPPDGFRKALSIGQQLLASPAGANAPEVHLWTAAAEGQCYEWLSQNNGTAAEMQGARDGALAHAKRVVELARDPNAYAWVLLRNMLDPNRPGAVPTDNDLEVFKNDQEFRRLIAPGEGN